MNLAKGGIYRAKGEWLPAVQVVHIDDQQPGPGEIWFRQFMPDMQAFGGRTLRLPADSFESNFEEAEGAYVFFRKGEAPKPIYAERPL